MTATVYGPVDKVSKSGDTMTGTLVLGAGVPLQIVAGAFDGAVLVSDSSGNVSWADGGSGGGGGAGLDSHSSDIQPLGTAAAGSSGLAADAKHVHPSTGVALLTGAEFTGAVTGGVEELTYASNVPIDATAGNHFRLILGGDAELASPSGGVDGQKITIELIQDGTGSRTVTYGDSFLFGTDLPQPDLSTGPGQRDFLAFIYDELTGCWFFVGKVGGFSASVPQIAFGGLALAKPSMSGAGTSEGGTVTSGSGGLVLAKPSMSAAATSESGGGVSAPSGPTGSWTLAWNDEFNNASGMSGHTNGLDRSKWNVGWYYGPSAPGGTGYDGLSYTASSGGGAVEFYGPGALAFPSGGGLEMSCYASGDGPDGASYSAGGHSSTTESGGINTAGIMNITPNTSYSVPSDIESTVIQAANIVIEVECQFAGPNDPAGAGAADGYWQYIGLYNCGDCSTPDYPNSGTWKQEIDIWEEVGGQGSTGNCFFLTFHQASSYASIVSTPSGVATTDLALAMHKYTVQFTYSTITLWVDGVKVSTISPTAAEVEAQWATPMYFNMQFQVFSDMTPTGGSEDSETATPWIVNYVRVFTQS